MNIKLSVHEVNADVPMGMGDISPETRDMNIGYGSGVNSNPSGGGGAAPETVGTEYEPEENVSPPISEFRDFFVEKIVSKINLESKRRKMKDALDFLKPSMGMSDWSGDAYSRPLDLSGRGIR